MYNHSSMKRVPRLYDMNERRPSELSKDGNYIENKNAFHSANLQEIFLNNCRKNEDLVRVLLVRGISKEGKIVGFDSQSIILCNDNTQILIYKSSIAAVIPEEPVQYIFNEINKREYCESERNIELHSRPE